MVLSSPRFLSLLCSKQLGSSEKCNSRSNLNGFGTGDFLQHGGLVVHVNSRGKAVKMFKR